ncbi:MAG TPA: DNA polymerase III subunit [Verrucomicrobiae bacterium]|nr:DNA polymerase III subunit [Verrucomicrobiae bacterium]
MSFSDVSQQPTVGEQLRRSLERGRLAHAYLFTGPRGSGKEAMARTLTKALNCLQRDQDCCPEDGPLCDSCRRINDNAHPDVYWIRPESKSRRIQVDQMREFMKAVNLRSSSGGVKVGIIVDAECMNEEASNAFLKTLEEPPAQTIIVLLSSTPQRLPPTILSRCLRIPFGQVAETEASTDAAKLLTRLAEFSALGPERVANSYRLLAEVTALLHEIRERTRQFVEAEVNLDRYEELEPNIRERLEDQREARVEGEYRAAREQVLEEIYSWFGDVLLCAVGAEDHLLARPERALEARRAATSLTDRQAIQNLEAMDQIRDSLARNISETFAMEVGLLKLTQ